MAFVRGGWLARAGLATQLALLLASGCAASHPEALPSPAEDDDAGDPRDAGATLDSGIAFDAGISTDASCGVRPVRWTTETIQSGDEIQATKIAVDSTGVVHVVYFQSGDYSLRYATNESGRWSTERLESNVSTYESTVAVGPDDAVHAVYSTYDDVTRLAIRRDGAWRFEDVPIAAGCLELALAVDSEGRDHVTCWWGLFDGRTCAIRYFSGIDGDWSAVDVTTSCDAAQTSAVAAGVGGTVAIAFYEWDYPGLALRIAKDEGAGLSIETADPASSGRVPGLAVAADGSVHVAYMSLDASNVMESRYATNASGVWRVETVDPSNQNGGGVTSLVLDDAGAAHIGYDRGAFDEGGWDADSQEIRYATNACGCWHLETIRTGQTSGTLTSAPSGDLHAAYLLVTRSDEYAFEMDLAHSFRSRPTCE